MKLTDLASSNLVPLIGVVASPASLRRAFLRLDVIRDARAALASGELSEEGLSKFIATLLKDFRPGMQFPHELTLASVAVVLEQRVTPFADDYLLDLARLHKKAEMLLAPGVAGHCLKKRITMSKVVVKTITVSSRLRHFWNSRSKQTSAFRDASPMKKSFKYKNNA